MSRTGVDHVVVAVPDLAGFVAEVSARGLPIGTGGRHPAHGTWNAVARIGPSTYLEILAADPGVDPGARSARGRIVAAVAAPTVYEVVLAAPDDLQALAREHELDAARPGRRRSDDDGELTWELTSWRTRSGVALPDLIRWGPRHPLDDLPPGDVSFRLHLTHPSDADVAAALRRCGAGPDVEVTNGPTGLLLELIGGALVLASLRGR